MMKKSIVNLVLYLPILCATCDVIAQNVGIGTSSPTRELSVVGSIVVDHDSTNAGSLSEPSLLFGSSGLTGINSNHNPLGADYHGLSFWTGGSHRMTITQNGYVGIGVEDPTYKLDIAGSLRASSIIYSGLNISAGYNVIANSFLYGTSGLRIGGGVYNVAYKLQLNDGDSFFGGEGTFTDNLTTNANMIVDGGLFTYGLAQIGGSVTANGRIYGSDGAQVFGNVAIAGIIDNNYRLRVYDGNARIGGDFHATGNAAIGGLVDNSLRFRVYGGNSRFGGDVEVTGELNTTDLDVSNNFTINGTGSVRSNGPSPLKISFNQKTINSYVYGGQMNYLTAVVPAFTGSSGDIRVMIAQFEPDPVDPGDYYSYMNFHVLDVDPDTDTFTLGISNPAPSSWIKGTLYYTVILKDN